MFVLCATQDVDVYDENGSSYYNVVLQNRFFTDKDDAYKNMTLLVSDYSHWFNVASSPTVNFRLLNIDDNVYEELNNIVYTKEFNFSNLKCEAEVLFNFNDMDMEEHIYSSENNAELFFSKAFETFTITKETSELFGLMLKHAYIKTYGEFEPEEKMNILWTDFVLKNKEYFPGDVKTLIA